MWKLIKVKGVMTLISLALIARILTSIVISRTTLAHVPNDSEFHHYFDSRSRESLANERSAEYCNAPGQNIQGLEGQPPSPNMKLLGTVLMIRHGDRLPISRPPAFEGHPVKQTMPCQLNPTIHPTNPLLQDYIKNVSLNRANIKRALNPVMHDFDLLPDTCSEVSITQAGIVQMLELGQFLGARYLEQNPHRQMKPQEVSITTSRFARTFQSLLAFLFGLSPSRFPEFVSGKIATSSSLYFCDSDSPSQPSHSYHCDCPKARQIPQLRATFRDWDITKSSIAYLHSTLKIDEQRMLATGKSLEVLNKIGPPPLSIASPSRIWDWLVSEYYCPGHPLPCVPNESDSLSGCLNSSVVKDLVHLVDGNHLRMINDGEYAKATSLAMYPFLASINDKFHELVKEKKSEKRKWNNPVTKPPFVWVLSGHDITIGPLFIALNMPLLVKVPYATRVAFELWVSCGENGRCDASSARESMRPFVRILLNGEDVTQRINFCEIQTSVHSWKMKEDDVDLTKYGGLCPLSYFNRFVKSDFFNNFNSSDYDLVCRL